MLTIFVRSNCAYSAMVLAKLGELSVPFDERNIAEGDNLGLLIAEGGTEQVPFMIDGETKLYESNDIVSYLDAMYGREEGAI